MNTGIYFLLAFLAIGAAIWIHLGRREEAFYENQKDRDPWSYEWIQPSNGPYTERYTVGTIVVISHDIKGKMSIALQEGGNVFSIFDENGLFKGYDEYLGNAIEEAETMLEMS